MGLMDSLMNLKVYWNTDDQTIYVERMVNKLHEPGRRNNAIKVSFDARELETLSKIARDTGYNEMGTFMRDEVIRVYLYVYAQSKNYENYVKDEPTIRRELFDCLVKNSRK